MNPTVLVEVTSPSTADYDRGEKLRHSQQLDAAREVVFVSHERPELTVHVRGDSGWTEQRVGAGSRIRLDSVGAEMDLDELYRGLEDAALSPG